MVLITFEIRKPENEADFVNLYDTVVCAIQEVDSTFPNYFLEANIMDDSEFEEIIQMLGTYYEAERGMKMEVCGETAATWSVAIV